MNLGRKELKPFIKYLKPYKNLFYVAAFFALLEGVTFLAIPALYGKIIDLIVRFRNFNYLVILMLAGWAVLEMTGNWFMRKKYIYANKIAYEAAADFVTKSINHILLLPLSFHKNKKIGEIMQRITRADSYVYQIVDRTLFTLIPYILMSMIAFSVIFWISWKIALIYIFFILIYIIVTIQKTNPIIQFQKKMNVVFEKIYGDVFDRTPNIISVKSNSNEDLENHRNISGFNKGSGLNASQVKMWMNLALFQHGIYTCGFIAIFGTGIYFVTKGSVSIGQFVTILAYVNYVGSSLYMLGGHYKHVQEGLVTIGRADKIFNEETEKYGDSGSIIKSDWRGNVEFKNISFSYEKQKVLDNISFKVKAGQMVAIVGKSGEGKTTLVDLISRYIIPQKGKIILDGISINKINLKNLRDQIAIVPQEIDLFNDSIRNNIGYSKIGASEEEIRRAAKLAHCSEFIEKYPKKYRQIVGEKGIKLSTGQKQRVAIARAILRDPKILVLDEATSALDSESEKYVQLALQEVMKNRTTFVIAHRLSTIRRADVIIVIEDSRIVESGNHAELMRHGGVYKKLSELQGINV